MEELLKEGSEEELRRAIMKLRYALEKKLDRQDPPFETLEHMMAAGILKEERAWDIYASDDFEGAVEQAYERLKDVEPAHIALALTALEAALMTGKTKEAGDLVKKVLEAAKELDKVTLNHILEHKAFVDDVVRYIERYKDDAEALERLLEQIAVDEAVGRELRKYLPRILRTGRIVAKEIEGKEHVSQAHAQEAMDIMGIVERLREKYKMPKLTPREWGVWHLSPEEDREKNGEEIRLPKASSPLTIAWLANTPSVQNEIYELKERAKGQAEEEALKRKAREAASRILHLGNKAILRALGHEKI